VFFFAPQGCATSVIRERKTDRTSITQMLSSMMIWTHKRSLLDVLAKEKQAVAWPSSTVTHHIAQMMLGTDNDEDIEVFLHNVLDHIQLPYNTFTEKNYTKREFKLGELSCSNKFLFSPKDTHDEKYLCVMDMTEGDVCVGGRMWLKITFHDVDKTTSKTDKDISRR